MNKEQKIKIVNDLSVCLTENKNIYFTEVSGLDAEQTSKLRRMSFETGVTVSVVKNTLLKKAMDASEKDFADFENILSGNTTLMVSEIANAPAKVIKNFLDKENFDQPYKTLLLKGGYVEESIYLGHDKLDLLVELKSKEELIGDVVTLLQSPMKNLLSSLGSAKQNISSLLMSLEKNPKSEDVSKSEESSVSEEESPSVDSDNKTKSDSVNNKDSVE